VERPFRKKSGTFHNQAILKFHGQGGGNIMSSNRRNSGHSMEPYPGLWDRARKFMDEKYPELHGIPSREMLIDLLLKEAGF
jgi:hypothetical protein